MTNQTGVAKWLLLATCVAFLPVSSAFAQEAAEEAESNSTDATAADEAVASAQPAEETAAEESAPATATDEGALAAADTSEGVEDIQVTGTRIKRKSIATAAPISVVTRQDLLASGRVAIEQILQQLPFNGNALNTQQNNGGNGAATINLRSLGANRTLVLVDGRRHVPGGDGVNAAVDLNAIPVSIIERVEILRDGASAVYGSDAISGVVNIITRTDFEGVEANAYSSISERGDGNILQLDFTAGAASENGNITFSASFFDQQPIFAGERDFSAVARGFNWNAFDDNGRPAGSTAEAFPLGSSSTPQGTHGTVSDPNPFSRGNAAWDATECAGGTCFNDPVEGWRTFGADTYNFQPENYLFTPNRRINFFSNGNYQINDHLGVFFQAGFTNRNSEQLLAPNPIFSFSPPAVVVSADNRYNPFGRDVTDIRRRMVEAGNRIFTQDSNTFRIVAGANGTLPDIGPLVDWSWDAYVNVGRTETINVQEGIFNITKLQQALGPDSECTGSGSCVPLNLFGGAGTITQDQIDFISFTGIDRGFTEQNVVGANMGGPLFELVENDPVALAFGYEFRKEIGADVPNPLAAAFESNGNNRNPTSGEFVAHAGYAELVVPLLANLPGVKSLEFNAAARFVEFDTAGSNFSYKLGLRWQPVEYAAIRGTYSTAFRAPSISELFTGVSDSFPNINDPCSSANGQLSNPVVAANCALDIQAGFVQDERTQQLARIGGNEDLDPETATVYTAGIVLEDSLIPGLTAAVDYYNIEIEDAIQSIGVSNILQGCYGAEDRQFCEFVQRDSVGFLQTITNTQRNVGGFDAQGIDFNVRYSRPTPFGTFGGGVEGTVLLEFVQIQATGFRQDLKGNFDQPTGVGGTRAANFDYRINWYLRWMYEYLNAGMNFRYLPSITECGFRGPGAGSNGACNAEGATDPVERETDDYFYMDIYAGVNVDTVLGNTSLTLGINNLTDTTPPFIANGFLAESDNRAYDYVGRQYYFRLSQRF